MSTSRTMWPEYLEVSRAELGAATPVSLESVGTRDEVGHRMAADIFDTLQEVIAARHSPTLIIPVGPVDQYPILADMINKARLDCRDVVFVAMDEYLDDEDQWIHVDHPLSFRGHLQRKFYGRLEEALAPPLSNRVVPDPAEPQKVERLIEQRGGVDACFGGIGINGHMAFNEPPEAGEVVDNEAFAQRSTRVLSLSRETRTINANTVGGEISVIPRRAITVGMREILGARRLRFYCNRPWQSAVVRRVLHGEITAACPASMLRKHPDAALRVADDVAERPDIRLR